MFRSLWTDYLSPILRRPPRYQVAALCWRAGESGIEILLLTSRGTGRWVLPKGWPKTGLDAEDTAREEAWEEGGVTLAPEARAIGRYTYAKRMRGGVPVHTEVDVFAFRLVAQSDDFPEASERTRRWIAPAEAADMVDEPDLATLLRGVEPRLRGLQDL
ncbi:NUDIX hydrolase [Mesobaculum littorinae]|uniref:NUDIX hydrolase n=1 Tax=Mesobaculum littorinae TaxID=2486419 RepID=A0A438AJB5_9RHOB|nr:NUDIX hydrolase [Mesobaculum littorinae]RVV98697.1 NUDIX hydrolase [Mesobaculum littorinae]